MPRSLALALVLSALAIVPASAHGATYTQHVCQLPDGTPTVADGFNGEAVGALSSWGNGCLAGDPLFASVPGSSASERSSTLSYHAPLNVKIVGARVTRDTSDIGSPGNAAYSFLDTSDSCAVPFCPSGISGGVYDWTGLRSNLIFRVECPGSGCTAPGPKPTINLRRLEIDLNDAGVPQITAPPTTGLFDASRTLRGVEPVSFTAIDAGGGVATASLVVDGIERDRRLLDANNGACRLPYTLRVPCKLSVAASYAFDTSTLADGQHSVALLVRDATEVNQATYGPVAITVDNRPSASPPDPSTDGSNGGIGGTPSGGASALRPPTATDLRRARIVGALGARTIRFGSATILRGRIEDEQGRPIAGAQIDVVARVRRSGAREARIARLTSGASGTFSYRLAAGASRDVSFRYAGGAAATATSQRAVVLVQAGVRLRQSAAALRNGQTLTLTADVLGPEVRRRSATVAFQVKVGNRWRTFAAATVDARGRARIRHRFRYTTTTTSYRFRARTIRTAALPYVTGVSPVTTVTVRPQGR